MKNSLSRKVNYLTHTVKGARLSLLPQKAILWENTLLVSDVHLGKVDHFRKNGMAIPHKAGADNYVRLADLIEEFLPERVIFLGDLFHSGMNQDWERFASFLSSFSSVSFELVLGNHDIIDVDIFRKHLKEVYTESLRLSPFILTHHPSPDADYYNLCGHIHPSFRLVGKAKQSIRLPCFHFSESTGVLPAFGTFTGTHTIQPEPSDDIFLIANEEVVKI